MTENCKVHFTADSGKHDGASVPQVAVLTNLDSFCVRRLCQGGEAMSGTSVRMQSWLVSSRACTAEQNPSRAGPAGTGQRRPHCGVDTPSLFFEPAIAALDQAEKGGRHTRS